MSIIKFVISDLHVADGHPILDCFGPRQQSALEGLLNAAGTAPFGDADDVELIINGDCFDFLAVPPYDAHGMADAATALVKLEKMIAAHPPFFEALRNFILLPGRHVTFITGNHDIELGFEEVRAHIREVIGTGRGVDFCYSRYYRPLPDVYIEHGNQYDFWNHASGLWNERGHPLGTMNEAPTPRTLVLPVGTQYFQRAAYPISIQYPYFDHFEPSMDSIRQIALLCLLNPDIIVATARSAMNMLSYKRESAAGVNTQAGAEQQAPRGYPVRAAELFEQAMTDFSAFQQDMIDRKVDWVEPAGREHAPAEQIKEYFSLQAMLSLPLVEAVTALCSSAVYTMDDDVTRGMHYVLSSELDTAPHPQGTTRGYPAGGVRYPGLRYAIAGHTHTARIDPINNGSQVYFNTGSWTTRYAVPTPGEMTPAMIAWLRKPDWNAIPLRDVTQLAFALIRAEQREPSDASLCVWEGGKDGYPRGIPFQIQG